MTPCIRSRRVRRSRRCRNGEAKIDPSIDMKTPPKIQVDTMKAGPFFAYAAELLKLHSPHITDQPIIARLKRIGFEPGENFDLDKADPAVKAGLEDAPEAAQQLMQWKIPTMARVANGWSMNTDTMGVYGNYYLKRAMVAQVGLGANLPEDAIYPLNLADETGKPLDGANNSTIHFDKGKCRQLRPSGRLLCMTMTASRSQTRSTASPYQAGCRLSTTLMDRSTSTSRTIAQVRTRKRIGYPHLKGRTV